jgi:hypothetical protein
MLNQIQLQQQETILTTTKITSTALTLQTISNELSLKDPQEVFLVLQQNTQRAMEDFQEQFISYIDIELQTASLERKELLLVVKSELQSKIWEMRLIKMLNGQYQILNEFLKKFERKEYFGSEKSIIKSFKASNKPELVQKIAKSFQKIFENTNSAKYANVDKWFNMFVENLTEEFGNYPYICWERVVIALKKEKPLDFPSLNEILKRLEFYESAFQKPQIEFLQKIGVL